MGHEHTDYCADGSRFVAVELRAVVEVSGAANVRLRMKGGSACWDDLVVVAAFRTTVDGLPTSPEEAATVADTLLRQAFPALF